MDVSNTAMADNFIDIDLVTDGGAGVKPGTRLRDLPGARTDGIIGAEHDGRILGLEDLVLQSGRYRLLKLESDGAMELFWHTASHVLAQAVRRLFPQVKLGIGPAIKDGFYYDFDFGEPISADELPRIEAEMQKIVAEDLPKVRAELSPE